MAFDLAPLDATLLSIVPKGVSVQTKLRKREWTTGDDRDRQVVENGFPGG